MKQIVFGESVQGASHKRVNMECQDTFKKLEYDDGTVIMAIADGHGSKACPHSKSGSSIAVNVFCKVMGEFYANYAENLEMLLTYLNREGDTKVAQEIDAEWKRRVLKVHTKQKREVPLTETGEKNKAEIYKQYGSTLVGMMITPIFIFAFQLGDGDISIVSRNGLNHLLEGEKILGVETHSLSKIDSWKRAVSVVRRRTADSGFPYMLMLSTDGFANSYKSVDDFQKTCLDYFGMIEQYGAGAVAANLKAWLDETSSMGCGDDITVLIAYFMDDGAPESEATVLIAKCGESHKSYGIRMEKTGTDRWLTTWAFPIKDSSAKREGYDKIQVKGDISFSDDYPGCPYCGGHGLTLCPCGHLSCTIMRSNVFTCEWCGMQGEIGNYSGETIVAGADY